MVTTTTDSYGGIEQVKGDATGYFHPQRVNGREWFIDPEGNGFFPLGISHIYSSDNETTVKDHYDYDQKAWVKDWFEKYRELGYNCAPAGGTSPCRDKQGFVDLEFVEQYFVDHKFPFVTGVWQFPHPAELRFDQERQDIFQQLPRRPCRTARRAHLRSTQGEPLPHWLLLRVRRIRPNEQMDQHHHVVTREQRRQNGAWEPAR